MLLKQRIIFVIYYRILVSNLPKSVNVEILTDRTTTIRASVKDVQFELGFGDCTCGHGYLSIFT